MWALPFLFLTASGRREIGLTEHGVTLTSMVLGGLAGAACGMVLFGIGIEIYGDSPNNWCISIRNYLHFEEMRGLIPPLGLFALYALPAIFLNPIGEEILFRGVVQQSFARRFNPALATIVNSVLFGLMYLSLHGLWRDGRGFHVHLVSATLAVLLMASIGAIFTLCRSLSGSLWPAVAAHAAFNLTVLGASVYRYFR
jgi:membrane protease YdiL (CAAX protease family)